MTCYFAAHGKTFDVDAFLRRSTLDPVDVVHRGEPVVPDSERFAKRYPRSSFTIRIGSRYSWKLDSQVRAARLFLRQHSSEVRRLAGTNGLERLCIDFGVENDPKAFCQSFRLPIDLIALAATAGVSLEISVYPESSGSERADDVHKRTNGHPNKQMQPARMTRREHDHTKRARG